MNRSQRNGAAGRVTVAASFAVAVAVLFSRTSWAEGPPDADADAIAASAPLSPERVQRATLALAPFESSEAIKSELAVGDDAFEVGDFGKARAHYETALRLAPKSPAARTGVLRARVALLAPSLVYAAAKGRRDVAGLARDLEKAARWANSFGPLLFELGRTYLLLGDATAATGPLKNAVLALAAEPEAHSALGVALLASGHANEAVASLGKAALLDPSSGPRHGNLGTALMMLGRTKEAIVEYEAAVRLSPGDPRAHSDLGTALLANNETARATVQLRTAVSLEPSRASFHSNLGYALQQDGHVADAIAEYRRALQLDDSLASAWINLGTALSRTRSTRDEARDAFLHAKRLDPTDPRVKVNLDELDSLEGARPKRSP